MGEAIYGPAPAQPHDARRWLEALAAFSCTTTHYSLLLHSPHWSLQLLNLRPSDGLQPAVTYVNLQPSLDFIIPSFLRPHCLCSGRRGAFCALVPFAAASWDRI